MRISIILLTALLAACSSKSARQDAADAVVKYGLIKAKQDVSMQQVESERRRTSTSVQVGASSGGGVAIGLGFLFSRFGSSSEEVDPVRYEIELVDGGQMTIYHDSNVFEVGDCVEIRVHPDETEHPPNMQRSKDGCG